MLVVENHEPMVPIDPNGTKLVLDYNVKPSRRNLFIARKSVVNRLILASLSLPDGIYLSIKETYRPKSFQSFIYNRRVIQLFCSEKHLTLTSAEVHKLAAEYIAPPGVAGHPTGGAVDVSLVDELNNEINLGCIYDEDSTVSEGRCYSFCNELERDAIENRKILFECMNRAGFINYPYEWWHWSYGDKYWAVVVNAPHAIFSALELK
ncbi:M15 family metallopeptidase [Vibrio mimicus]|nr:M15 family metallopeptidase [Vibrio mimicus]